MMVEAQDDFLFISNSGDRLLVCILGCFLSIYSYYIELRKEANPNYRAVCDFGKHLTCSRVLTSRYSRGFGLVPAGSIYNFRNCNLGISFYLMHIILGFSSNQIVAQFLLGTSLFSIVVCVYLAYILVFVLEDACVLCISTYVCNGVILYLHMVRKDL